MKDIKCKLTVSMGLSILTFTAGGNIYEYHTWNKAKAEQINYMAVLRSGTAFNKAQDELWRAK